MSYNTREHWNKEWFYLNTEAITKDKHLPNFIRMSALYLDGKDYSSCGELLEVLSDSDITDILEISIRIAEDSYSDMEARQADYKKHILFTSLMLRAEGEPIDPENITKNMNVCSALVTVENLHRTTGLKIIRKNFSMVETDLPLIELGE